MQTQINITILQWLLGLTTLALLSTIFRLTALNTFVDHRKTALRNQLKDKIKKKPKILLIIQNIGKFIDLRTKEKEVFDLLGEGYYDFIVEIYDIRGKYNSLSKLMTVIVVEISILAIILFYLESGNIYFSLIFFLIIGCALIVIINNISLTPLTFNKKEKMEAILDEAIGYLKNSS